ncbi:MAG: hypothetical protein ACM3XN_06560 [Chloroflexota bacterium]
MTPSVNLLPPDYRRDKRRLRLLIGAAIGLAVAVLGVWTGILAGNLASLKRDIADVGLVTAQYATALESYNTLKELEARLGAAVKSAGRPAVQRSVVMGETLRLADGVQVAAVDVSADGATVIGGEASGLVPVAAYLERLGQSGIIDAPVLASISRDALSGRLHFEIRCRAKGGGQ